MVGSKDLRRIARLENIVERIALKLGIEIPRVPKDVRDVEGKRVKFLYTKPNWYAQQALGVEESLAECIRVAAKFHREPIVATAFDGAGRGVGSWYCEPDGDPIEVDSPKPGEWPEGAKP